MKLIPIFPGKLWQASIYWSNPKDYDRVKENRTSLDGKAHFYNITGKRRGKRKLLYIGKTYSSEVHFRLRNNDHIKRRKKLLKQGFSHLQVSHGILNLNLWKGMSDRYPRPKRIDDIETLLILSNHIENAGANERKHKAHRIVDHYKVTNTGNYKPLKRQIFLTIFATGEAN